MLKSNTLYLVPSRDIYLSLKFVSFMVMCAYVYIYVYHTHQCKGNKVYLSFLAFKVVKISCSVESGMKKCVIASA